MDKDYIYYDLTTSLCSTCYKRVSAKIIFENAAVYMIKTCKEHGFEKVLIATDIEYYKNIRNYNKKSEYPKITNTETLYGCPYDCGLCPDHEQHSCLTIVEVTDRCNLSCPTCFANSSPTYGRHRTLEEVKLMIDAVVKNEGEPDVLQISGGEPTIHPHFFEILDYAKQQPIKHLMVNTNGVRIAKDEDFVKQLAAYMPDFEIYLQFDSFKPVVLQKIRGKDLTDIRKKAIEHLNKYNLSTTLVVTLEKGSNDDEIGKIIEYALQQPCVRGVTFQPTQMAGRLENFEDNKNRLTLTEVRNEIIQQSNLFTAKDVVPVPCNPDSIAMAYAFKIDGKIFPLTRYINPQELLQGTRNTIAYEYDDEMKNLALKVFSTGISVDKVGNDLQQLLCCIPLIEPKGLSYENLFRIIIIKFMDAQDFDVRSIKKSCVHIVNKDYKIIPFETMNMFYRDDKKELLNQLIQQ